MQSVPRFDLACTFLIFSTLKSYVSRCFAVIFYTKNKNIETFVGYHIGTRIDNEILKNIDTVKELR